MADTALIKKLRLLPNQRALVLVPPEGYLARLQPPPEGCLLHTSADGGVYGFVQIFATNSADLTVHFPGLFAHFAEDAIFWACYPKTSSGVETDLTRDVGWQVIHQAGYGGIASISIDDIWSGVRFRPQPSPEEWLADQYSGKKAHLRHIYDRLVEIISRLGDDVELSIRKNYVAFYRGRQFALVKASTASRVDVGLKLSDPPTSPRLEAAATFGSGALTHKVALASLADVDGELESWLAAAYAGAG